MKNPTRIVAALATALLVVGSAGTLAGDSGDDAPTYPRFRKGPSDLPRPMRRVPVPDELQLDHAPVVRGHTATRYGSSAPAARTRPSTAPPEIHDRSNDAAIRTMAVRAARIAAESVFRVHGVREYYRVGFFEGLRAGNTDGRGTRLAFAEGELAGLRDVDAIFAGEDLGASEAVALARIRAEEQVESQFRDLSRPPRYLPRYGEPLFEPATTGFVDPTLSDVYADFPAASFEPIHARYERYLNGWDYDAPRLGRCDSYTEFYDASWSDPEPALRFWSNGKGAETMRQLRIVSGTARFRQAFLLAYPGQLAQVYAVHGPPAHDLGFDDGWAYATFVREELAFRRGYASGFRRAYADGSLHGFHGAYPQAYEFAYRAAFREWSDNPKVEIARTWLDEVDEDGIFSPGEELRVGFEVVNYGGRGGELGVRLDGDVLARPAWSRIEVPRRARVPAKTPVAASLDAGIPSPTRAQLELRVDQDLAVLPIRVEHALQIDRRAMRVLRDDLDGEVRIEARVRNVSRRPLSALLELTTPTWRGEIDPRRIDPIVAGGHVDVAYDIQGLRPLDMIAGDVSFELVTSSGGVVHDAVVHDLRDTVRELGNRSLLDYMTRLALDESASRSEIRRARDLMLVRLREDWKVAVIGRGNPYKADFKHGSRRTALGDLVATTREMAGSTVRSEVFDGLRGEVERLARNLPGAHPFLRKYVRRLASRL